MVCYIDDDAGDVFRVGGIAQGPVVHGDLYVLLLSLPYRIHEDVDGALGGCLGVAVEHRDSQHYAQTGVLTFFQHRLFAREFRLAVEICGVGGGVGFVGCLAWFSGEDVVGGDVDGQDGAGACCLGYSAGCGDVESSSAVRVGVAFVWETVRGAWVE